MSHHLIAGDHQMTKCFLNGDEIVYYVWARSILWILHLQLMLIRACNSVIQYMHLVQLFIHKYQVGIHTLIPHIQNNKKHRGATLNTILLLFCGKPWLKTPVLAKANSESTYHVVCSSSAS